MVEGPVVCGATIFDFEAYVGVDVRVMVTVCSWDQILDELGVVCVLWASSDSLWCWSTWTSQILEGCRSIAVWGPYGCIVFIFLLIIIFFIVSLVVYGTVASRRLVHRSFNLLDRSFFFSFFLRFLDEQSVDTLHLSKLVLFRKNALWIQLALLSEHPLGLILTLLIYEADGYDLIEIYCHLGWPECEAEAVF